VDTVHRGQQDGKARPFPIKSGNSLTQWEVVGRCQAISENQLIPVLEVMLSQCPCNSRGFHSDNGPEFLNDRVAAMLNKLLAGLTKSRRCRSTGNAVVEGKNGAVVRNQAGYGLIGTKWARRTHAFYRDHLSLYLNDQRPCRFAIIKINPRGLRRRRYRSGDCRTPCEKLTSFPDATRHLKRGVTARSRKALAIAHSDTEAATRMRAAKQELLTKARSASARGLRPPVSPLLGARGLHRRPRPRPISTKGANCQRREIVMKLQACCAFESLAFSGSCGSENAPGNERSWPRISGRVLGTLGEPGYGYPDGV
jgi:hypothetical protein